MYKADKWKILENDYFIIKYNVAYDGDSKKVLNYAINSCQLLKNKYFYTLPSRTIKVYLYDKKTSTPGGIVDIGTMCTNREKGEIYIMTPSVAICASSYYDEGWYQKNFIHEYVHVVVGEEEYHRRGKYYPNYFPEWFDQGVAEYISLFNPPPIAKVFCQKDISVYEEKVGKIVRQGCADFNCMDDVNSWGMFAIEYLCETYSDDKIAKLIKSNAPTFKDAMKKELEVTYIEFEDGWRIWLNKKFGL